MFQIYMYIFKAFFITFYFLKIIEQILNIVKILIKLFFFIFLKINFIHPKEIRY